ncbi:MAG: glycosyltransferase [Pseudomonadota bacterium]
MIFVTVGNRNPFDRLLKAVDEIAADLPEPVFAQIGPSGYTPANVQWVRGLTQNQYDRQVRDASLVVAHGAVGAVLCAQKYRKPIVLVPRRPEFGEHATDAQLAACEQMADRSGITVVSDLSELPMRMRDPQCSWMAQFQASGHRDGFADRLREFMISV